MTQEEKLLLLKDLCARLPYGVKIKEEYGDIIDVNLYNVHIEHLIDRISIGLDKLILRPLSSMTKEERKELEKIVGSNPIKPYGTLTDTCDNLVRSCAYGSFLMLQYLYSHHFDVINLIEKGLAIAVTKENNPYEKK